MVLYFLTQLETRLNNFLSAQVGVTTTKMNAKNVACDVAADSRTQNDDLDRSGYKTETRSNAFVVCWHQSAKFL